MSKSEVKITIEAYDVAGFEAARAAVRALGPCTLQGYSIDHGVKLRGPLRDRDLELCGATATFIVSLDTDDVDVRAAYASLGAMCDEAREVSCSASATSQLRVNNSR